MKRLVIAGVFFFPYRKLRWCGASLAKPNVERCGSQSTLFMPRELAKEIRANFKWREEGWGRMKVTVKIGESVWKTSVWLDTKNDTYLLPVKAAIRKKEKLEMEVGKEVATTIWI